MEESTSREKVLKKIRNALISQTDPPYSGLDIDAPVFKELDDSLEVNFAQEFTEAAGKFVYCAGEKEFLQNLIYLIRDKQWENLCVLDKRPRELFDLNNIKYIKNPDDFLNTQVGITQCEFLIARLGSIMVSSNQASGRRLNAYPEVHIVLAYTSQLVADMKEAFEKIDEKYGENKPSMISVITGPSRTGDIEKTLVMGAHGPKELYVFLVEDLI